MTPDIDLGRLCRAVEKSRRALQCFREERREAVRQYVGHHWSTEGARARVPVNLIGLYLSTVSRNLVAKAPRVLLSTFKREHKATLTAMQIWANQAVQKMGLADTLQSVVMDALLSVGVCKVALASPGDAAAEAWGLRAGEPFCARVDLDDFFFDTNARDFRECQFIGHRYRVPLVAVRDSDLYSKKGRKNLQASTDQPYNREGDERLKQMGQQYVSAETDEFEDMVDLWEIYLPRHRVVVTLADHDGEPGPDLDGEPLRVQPWLGPAQGPYHFLAMLPVPDNAMPKAPVQDLVDLHEGANNAYRKFLRMVHDIKDVTVTGNPEDAQRILDAIDGQMVQCSDPARIQQLTFRAQATQAVLAGATAFKDLFDWLSGNLSVLGGLSTEAKTLGQEKLLNANSSRVIADMADRVVAMATNVVSALCWYWHHHPEGVMQATHEIPGVPEYGVDLRVGPQDRDKVPFEAMQIKIDVYSMQTSTPQTRMQFLIDVVTQVVAPLLPLLQQQGISFDLNKWLQKISELGDQPDLADILTIQEPPSPDGGNTAPAQPEPRMPANTSREYVRHNVSQRTRQGNDQDMIARMFGHDLGGAQKNGKA